MQRKFFSFFRDRWRGFSKLRGFGGLSYWAKDGVLEFTRRGATGFWQSERLQHLTDLQVGPQKYRPKRAWKNCV